jgi:hypothetical protein
VQNRKNNLHSCLKSLSGNENGIFVVLDIKVAKKGSNKMSLTHRCLKSALILVILINSAGSIAAADLGKTLWSVTYFGEGESDYFHRPSDIAVDHQQSLVYIADSGNHRVVVFDLNGNFVRIIGQKGQGPGEFNNPTGLCVDGNSRLAVADYRNNRIQIFAPQGKFLNNINTKEIRVADLLIIDGLFYTIPSFGASGFNINMGSDAETQPLVVVLDNTGDVVSEITISDFPEKQPFVRALKNRVTIALSPEKNLFLPFSNMNLVYEFDLQGNRLGQFQRELPFEPITPSLKSKRTSGDGENKMVQMIASIDMVTQASHFGPDGHLYILGYIESLDKKMKEVKDMRAMPDPALRIDVIDPANYKLLGTLACEAATRAFAALGQGQIISIYEDEEGEIVLKCAQY